MENNDRVLVKIMCEETLQYEQLVEMDRSKWEALKLTTVTTMRSPYDSPLNRLLDKPDPNGSCGYNEVFLEVVNEEGSSVTPEDLWNE